MYLPFMSNCKSPYYFHESVKIVHSDRNAELYFGFQRVISIIIVLAVNL